MSHVGNFGVFDEGVPAFTTHVFICPCCHNETTVLSASSFITLEQTQCEHCARQFVIENDVARALRQ